VGADTVVLDLEDGVALDKKDEARTLVEQTLQSSASFGTSELAVRINGLETDFAKNDLEAVLTCPRLQSIVVPKVETADDIHFVQDMISQHIDVKRDVRIIAAVESALGILNLRDIAKTSQKDNTAKLDALVFASEDYCADIEAIRTPHAMELLYARSKLVTVAKAYGLQAIDMVHIDFRDMDALEKECIAGRQLGFTGKQAIHPGQVETVQHNFAPSEKDIDFATRCLKEYESSVAAGKGACVVDGIVVDLPVYKWSQKIVVRAKQAGLLL
jgi:citrate lyase subunit beta-like protein